MKLHGNYQSTDGGLVTPDRGPNAGKEQRWSRVNVLDTDTGILTPIKQPRGTDGADLLDAAFKGLTPGAEVVVDVVADTYNGKIQGLRFVAVTVLDKTKAA